MKASMEFRLIEMACQLMCEIREKEDRIIELLEKNQCCNTTKGGTDYTSVKDVAEAIVRAVKPDDSTKEGDEADAKKTDQRTGRRDR